ncbi:pyridoxamine 5'-phosphate oxidase family protein [Martelella limonii]|uniref:pyridoxamine 5'-phosphate oxidase family protein n=1 Tax=Martelella limonii TaxID=1647649 RepID=UPI001580161C|nr:pyridoxamine 5'-phosphate oxidase family protein [Martelella limonii]
MTIAFSRTIDAFLLDHHVMSVATSDADGLWAASVFYVADRAARRLLFFTSASTRHGAALLLHGAAAVTIAGQDRDISRLCGLQASGRTAMLDGEEARKGEAIFKAAFPEASGASAQLWSFSPAMIKLTDNGRGFGHKERWSAGD